MIREIEIEGFKSIERLKLELGRVTVLIGENGCGKSNILEAIAFASAACGNRLDHEFLASRGIRATEPDLMVPAFAEQHTNLMRIRIQTTIGDVFGFDFREDHSSVVPKWSALPRVLASSAAEPETKFGPALQPVLDAAVKTAIDAILGRVLTNYAKDDAQRAEIIRSISQGILEDHLKKNPSSLGDYLVFSPENSALRAFLREGQILPIGINGEGMFAHLRALVRAGRREVIDELNRRLELIDWFSSFDIPDDLGPGEHRLSIRDRYLASDVLLDQRSANEGFLFLLFYYTLFLSPDTPTFFAIDNIDASLNPRLCARLMSDVAELAKQQDRQVVVTTHNPAVLDGLNLMDDDQRLVVVSRTPGGATRVRRVRAPEPIEGAPPLRLSEAFIQGFLGGLPGNF